MARSLTTRLSGTVIRNFRSIPTSGGPIYDDSNSFLLVDTLTSGTGAAEANVCYHATEVLSTGEDLLIDVHGTLSDPFGNTIRMNRVKVVLVKHLGTAGTITVGGGSNSITTLWGTSGDGLKIGAEGLVLWWAPDATAYAVTAGTAENLRIIHNSDAGGLDIDVEFYIVGVED